MVKSIRNTTGIMVDYSNLSVYYSGHLKKKEKDWIYNEKPETH